MHSIWLVFAIAVLGSSVRGGQIGDLSYQITNDQVTITGCKTSAEGELVIPAEIEGLPVTSIGHVAFRNRNSLTSVTIPDSVTSIGDAAFSSCESLTSINIGKGVTSIDFNVFFGCISLTSITIPDSVTSIGDSAFSYCFGLTSIIIPDSVRIIYPKAFWACRNLASITIPESVTAIYYSAFYECSSLASVTIPKIFHSQSEANRLRLGHLWPDGFFLPSSITRTPEVSIGLPLQLTLTGDQNTTVAIEVANSVSGPWTEWQTVVIGEEGTTEVDLDEGAEKRFYRVRD